MMLDFAIRDLLLGLLAALVSTEPAAEGDGKDRGKVARAGIEAAALPVAWPAGVEAHPGPGDPLALRHWAIRRAAQDSATVVKVYADGAVLIRLDPVP